MTSTSLQNRKKFSALLKSALKKQWIYLAVCGALTILILLIFSAVTLTDSLYSDYFEIMAQVSVFMMIALASCTLFSFVAAPRLFKEIYKKQQCDIYFSLPVKREEYFAANYIAGLIANLSIYTVCVISAAIQASLFAKRYAPDVKMLILHFAEILMVIVLAYTVFVLCAAISGKRVHYILVSLLLTISSTFALDGFVKKLHTFWGLYVADFLNIFNLYSIINTDEYGSSISPLPLISYIIITIAVFVLAFICFKNRKSEVAQTSLSGKVFPLILLAIFIASAFYYGDSWGPKYIGVMLGLGLCAICGLIYSSIFFKKRYTKQSAIVTACTAAICAVITIIPILPNQMREFEKRVPEENTVESVSINPNTDYYAEDTLMPEVFSTGKPLQITSEEAISKVIVYNNAICEDAVINLSKSETNISALKTRLFGNLLDFDNQSVSTYDNILITYKLKSGRTVKKFYSIANGAKSTELAQVLTTQDVFDNCELFNIEQKNILKTNISKYKQIYTEGEIDEYGDEYYEDGYAAQGTAKHVDNFRALMEAYRKDIMDYNKTLQIRTMINLSGNTEIDYDNDIGLIDKENYMATENSNYIIDVYYYEKNISDKDRQIIESLNAKQKDELFNYSESYGNYGVDYEVPDKQIDPEIDRLSKYVIHRTLLVCRTDQNASAYIDNILKS